MHAEQLSEDQRQTSLSAILIPHQQATPQSRQEGRRHDKRMMRIPETRKRAKKDGRKSNRGVSTRSQFTMQQKMEILAKAEEFQLQHGGSFQMFFDKHYGSNSEAVFANFRRWVLPAQRFKIEAAVLDGLRLKAHASFQNSSPFQE